MRIPWNRWYSIKSYIRSALWVVPVFALLCYMVVTRIMRAIGAWLWHSGRIDEATAFLGLSMPGARAALETIVTLNMSFIVFTFGSLLVAIQVASGQYTPRIIATTFLRDNSIRYSVGYFVFTLLFSLRTLTRMDVTTVHQFNLLISALLGLFSLVIFLYLIDYAARMLRPVSIVQRVARDGLAAIEEVYPDQTMTQRSVPTRFTEAAPFRTVVHEGNSGIILAVNLAFLIGHAHRFGGIIEIVPHVGDFVAVGEPLFRIYGETGAIKEHDLREAVAFGTERTIEQDPTFAFRILVDIASKALSPAINDPTTATHAIDQLHRLLMKVGGRHLRGEEFDDRMGNLRLIFRTPNWEDYVHLAFTEIRHFGAGSIQIARRLRSMLEVLIHTLPEHRHRPLCIELNLLDREIERCFGFPEDLALARIPDPQGLGSSRRVTAEPLCPVHEKERV
jgi:uncharacterized membrane protein